MEPQGTFGYIERTLQRRSICVCRIRLQLSLVVGGMGRGISHCLSREGADVVVADLNLARAQATVEVVEKNGRKGRAIVADVASETACQALVAEALETFGQIDIIVNNAGHFGGKLALPFTNKDEAEWDDNYAVNVKGPFFLCKATADHMIERQ